MGRGLFIQIKNSSIETAYASHSTTFYVLATISGVLRSISTLISCAINLYQMEQYDDDLYGYKRSAKALKVLAFAILIAGAILLRWS